MWKKVVAPTLLVCLVWLLVSGATTYGIYTLSRSHATILTDNVASIRAVGVMQESLWRLQVALLDITDDERGSVPAEFVDLEAQFERSLEDADKAATTLPEQDLVKEIRRRFSEYRDFIHRSVERTINDRSERGDIEDRSAKKARSVSGSCTELLALNERLMTAAVARGAQLERALYVVRVIFLITGPGVGVYVGLRIARNLQTSISQISVTLKDASGDLDHEVGCLEISPPGDPDELRGLNRQVQAVSARIRQVLSELQKARHEAILSERLAVVGELAAGVAHELRNPLTSVKLLIQTAPQSGPEIRLQEKQAHVILQEISRMEATIQGLLDFARPPALNRITHDLRDTVRRALNLVAGRAVHEGITIVPRLPATPLFVNADPEQLHQVFVNLLINGIDSMPRAGTLHVTAESSPAGAGSCRVVVADRGDGIPADRLGRIFEPFVTTKERGTGLGLAVSGRIVREHGGTIAACNRPEGGAAFTVELPLARPESLPAVSGEPAESAPPRSAAPTARELPETQHA